MLEGILLKANDARPAYTLWYADNSWPGCESPDELLVAQGNSCAVCAKNFDEPGVRMMLDHCHFCGLVRGWLCNNCNVRESSSTADDMVAYRSMPPAKLARLSVTYPNRRSSEALERYRRNLAIGYKTGALPGDCTPDVAKLLILALARADGHAVRLRNNWAEIFRLREIASAEEVNAQAAQEAAASAELRRKQERPTVLAIFVLAAILWSIHLISALKGFAIPESNSVIMTAILGLAYVSIAFAAAITPWMLWRPMQEVVSWPNRYPYSHIPVTSAAVVLFLFSVFATLGQFGAIDSLGFQIATAALICILAPCQIAGIVLSVVLTRRIVRERLADGQHNPAAESLSDRQVTAKIATAVNG